MHTTTCHVIAKREPSARLEDAGTGSSSRTSPQLEDIGKAQLEDAGTGTTLPNERFMQAFHRRGLGVRVSAVRVSRGEGVACGGGVELLLDYPPNKKIAKGETT
jgi:hypothetical protein